VKLDGEETSRELKEFLEISEFTLKRSINHKIYKEGILQLLQSEKDENPSTKWVILTDKYIGVMNSSKADGPEDIITIDSGFKIFILNE
jgi:hypothetical protein